MSKKNIAVLLVTTFCSLGASAENATDKGIPLALTAKLDQTTMCIYNGAAHSMGTIKKMDGIRMVCKKAQSTDENLSWAVR